LVRLFCLDCVFDPLYPVFAYGTRHDRDDVNSGRDVPQTVPMQVIGGRPDQSALLAIGYGAGWVYQAARPSISNLEEHQGIPVPANQIKFPAAVVDVLFQNGNAVFRQIAGGYPFVMISNG